MNRIQIKLHLRSFTQLVFLLMVVFLFAACSSRKKNVNSKVIPETISTNTEVSGIPLHIEFRKGPAHNHPLMAIWLEDLDGNYIETLYVASSIGTGLFGHAVEKDGNWESGPVRRPAALPYWWHKYGYLPDQNNKVPDAITGPTPAGNFILKSKTGHKSAETVNILFEINQSWDWNEYWTNDKYPENGDYMSSSQPALVYKASIKLSGEEDVQVLKVIGHSHYSGADGSLTEDISSLSTALQIAGVIKVSTGVK